MGAESETDAAPDAVTKELTPTPPAGVSKKTLAMWKKQLKNLKTKDAGKKTDGLRYCAQDELFVREQSEVLPVLIELLSRVKMPDVVAETLRTFKTLFTQTQTEAAWPTSAEGSAEAAAVPAVVELHPQQNRQFVVDASIATAANPWKAGEPFVALFGANVAPEIKIQAIDVFSVLLEHCTQLALTNEQTESLVAFQTSGAPATVLLTCLAIDHAALQLAALNCLCMLFEHPPSHDYLTAFHTSDGLTKIQAFADKPERGFHVALLKIADSFSHHEIGRAYLRATGMAGTIQKLLAGSLETTTQTLASASATPTAAISLTVDEATLMHQNVSVASRVYARMLFAKEVPTVAALEGEYESVPVVVDTLIAILQRDINSFLAPAPAAAAPAGNNAAAQAAAAAAASTAATLAALFPFSAAKCVDMLTSLGRMVEASDLVQRYGKSARLLPVLLQCFRVTGESALHQSADKLLHLSSRLSNNPKDTESLYPGGLVDPQLFSATQTIASDGDAPTEQPALLTLDSFLPILETASAFPPGGDGSNDAQAVAFRLVRWLAVVVDAPANAQVLGDATINIVAKILQETKSSETILCGFLSKCIQAIAFQSAEACELCSSETRNPVAALTAFMHTAYPLVDPMPTQRAASVASEIESLAIVDTKPTAAMELSADAVAVHKLEWVSEFDEFDTFEPYTLTQQCHTFDAFFFAAKALEVLASAYTRRASSDSNTPIDFAELLTQRLEAASKTTAAANATKKKPAGGDSGAAKTSSSGEGIVLCVLEKVADVFTLLGMFSSKNGDVAVSLLTTIRTLLQLPGGVRAMLVLAKTASEAAVPVETPSEGDEPVAPPVVHHANPSAWPWTREEAQHTEYGWLLTPILSVFETPVTCFYQLEAAVTMLSAFAEDVPVNSSPPTAAASLTGVISSVDVHIDDTDRFLNAALCQGALVYLIAILDSERVPRCPKDTARREELAQRILPLALRLIERGAVKQRHALATRQELLELHEQLTAAAAAAAAGGTAAGAKHTKPDSGPTIDVASLHSQKLEYQSSWARELLDAAFDIPRFGYQRVPALLLAVQLGQDEIANALLAAGVTPDATSSLDSTTPLMLALLTKNKPLVLALLEAGASVDAITQDGLDVTVWACALTAPVRDDLAALIARIHGSKVATRLVLPLDALVELDSEQGAPDVALFETLLARGLDVNVSNGEGDFVLHALLSQCVVRKRMRGLDMCFRYASASGHIDRAVVAQLVARVVERHRADVNACNRLGQTPLHAALLHGHALAALYLLENGANPNVRDVFGLLPLHYACLGFFEDAAQAVQVVDALLASAIKHELLQGVHTDPRKYKTALEKEAVDVEALLDRGFADVSAPPALTRTLATTDDVLGCASQPPDGFLPWHLACGACSHLNVSSLCLTNAMDASLHTNGAIRAAILSLLVQKYQVLLEARTARQLTGLHLAVKTDVDGSNSAVLDVLLASKALPAVLNAVHEPTTIDALLPIEDGALVELTTDALLYVPHAHVSSRSFQHKYHVILPDGNHLQGLDRTQLMRTASSSTTPQAAARYTLRMESAFSALHYALQSSDALSRRLLDLPGVSLQPEGSDLPLLALACAARRAPDVVARLVTPQVNVRVYLPLHDGTSHEQSGDGSGVGASSAAGGGASRAAGRKQAAALHFAVIYEDVALVRTLVARKDHTNVNVRRSGDGFTPLHLACGMGNLEIVRLLLDFGASLIQMSTVSSSSSGVTPLHLLVKSDGMENEKLRQLIHDGYVKREMLLEGLGAPAIVPLKAASKQDEQRDAVGTADAASSGVAFGAGDESSDEMEISCVLLDEEEHNLSLYNHVEQLVANRRGATGYALRLQSELAKSDDVLSLFFQLIFGASATSGRASSLANVTEEDAGASDTPRGDATGSKEEEASLLDARLQFGHLKHWHECYAQQQVRSKWLDPTSSDAVAKMMRRSSFDRRSTRELLAFDSTEANQVS